MNRTRTIVTIIGIILSVALITVVAGIYTSFNQSMIDMVIHNTGDYDLALSGSQTKETIRLMEDNEEVRDVYTSKTVGIAKLENGTLYTPYVSVVALSPNTFQSGFDFTLKEGRYPQKDDEIVLTKEFLNHTITNYQVGDQIPLELGVRTMASDATETVETADGSTMESELSAEMYFLNDNEVFVPKTTKTYTITGIVDDCSGTMATDSYSACVKIYTTGNIYDEPLFTMKEVPKTYLRFTDSAEKDFKNAFGRLVGIRPEIKDMMFSNRMLSESEQLEITVALLSCKIKFENFLLNYPLLSTKGIDVDSTGMLAMISLIGFVLLLIVLSSVFIIRNSFSISITEKTKLYGMLAATGATSRQIRRNVLFEGLVLGIIGIPLGLLLGVGVTAGLVALVNGMMGEFIGNMRFVMSVPYWAILVAAGLGALTIFFSVYNAAVRASKISPIEAIRSNTDIKISGKKKPQSYRTPRWIQKLFGAGGTIAWKNMKRNRKQYRTTVISIIVSVAVYISIFSFVEYGVSLINDQLGGHDYNMAVIMDAWDENGKTYPLTEQWNRYEKLRHMSGIEKSVISTIDTNYNFEIPSENLTPKVRALYGTGDLTDFWIKCVVVDNERFDELLKPYGLSGKEHKNQAFLYNQMRLEYDDPTYEDVPFLKDFKGLTLKGTANFEHYVEYDEYDEINEGNIIDPDVGDSVQEAPIEPEKKSVQLTIVDELPQKFNYAVHNDNGYHGYLLISKDTFLTMLPAYTDDYSYSLELNLYSDDCDTLEEDLSSLAESDRRYSGMRVENFSKQLRQNNSLIILAQIFVYGFIIVIVLIGLTNVFNTITTNMKMRRQEFAVLQSIGMTKREFNRMISLESLLYTVKSLLIGLPIGIGSSVLIYFLIRKLSNGQTDYAFPWVAVLLSISVVMLLVWIIMRFSIKKVHKQNIIETIRNDNI